MKAKKKITFTQPVVLLLMQLCALYSIFHVLTLEGSNSESQQMQLIFSASVIVLAALFTMRSLAKMHSEEHTGEIQNATF